MMRARAYRIFARQVLERVILPWVAPKERIETGQREWSALYARRESSKAASRPRIWFHASSVGELESLWPVAVRMATSSPEKAELVLTVFSASARGRVDRLKETVEREAGRVRFSGYSPWEGSWERALDFLEPDLFVTAKYEAWPELWVSLAERKIPLAILAARGRSSLSICRKVCRAMGSSLPRLLLLPTDEKDVSGLRQIFGESTLIQPVGEPRWDQVALRSRAGNPRAAVLLETLGKAPRPWGILGSAWPEDLAIWEECLTRESGTVWIVPHRVEVEHVDRMERWLVERGERPLRTSRLKATDGQSPSRRILVDEMGFLSELYRGADWTYVGGGFSSGVHSTIEPALHGIPVSTGPEGAGRFSEIRELQASGQLTLIGNSREALEWRCKVAGLGDPVRQAWREQAERRLGATEKVATLLFKELARELA